MNIIELCKLAVQAGIGSFWRVGPLVRFARLVAEREREACAKLCEDAAAKISDPLLIGQAQHDTGKTVCANLAARIRARTAIGATGGTHD